MRLSDFTEAMPGELVALQGTTKTKAFVPAPVPRNFQMSPGLLSDFGNARAALGEAKAVRARSGQRLLERVFQANEAVTSSRIEGTHTTLVDALVDEALPDLPRDDDGRAVENYRVALQTGLHHVGEARPIGLMLLRSLHAALVQGDPRSATYAGRFREKQVAIGGDAAKKQPELARFIPPPPEHVVPCLEDLERYLSDDVDDGLIRCAMTHYQFETIHPFEDGNGRVGRILIALQMVTEGLLGQPCLYLSNEIERREEEHKERLYRVSSRGDFEGWLKFFFEVVTSASRSLLSQFERIAELRAEFKARLTNETRAHLPFAVLEHLLDAFPICTTGNLVDAAVVSNRNSARAALLELERCRIVQRLDSALRTKTRGRPSDLYVCYPIIDVIEGRAPRSMAT